MNNTNITRVGTNHIIWQKGFGFYSNELEIMKHRLEEIASRNTTFEVRQQIEHFQNQIIVQRNNIDELSHEVNLYIENLSRNLVKAEDQILLHGKYQDFERVMNLLRHEFDEFLTKGI